jgi:hypothetical protein
MWRIVVLCVISGAIGLVIGYKLRPAPTTDRSRITVPIMAAHERSANAHGSQLPSAVEQNADRTEPPAPPVREGFVAVPKRLMNFFYFNPFNLDFKLEPEIVDFLQLDSSQRNELQTVLFELKKKIDDTEADRIRALKSDPTSSIFILEGDTAQARKLKEDFEEEVRHVLPAPQCDTFLSMCTHAFTVTTGDFGSKSKICRVAPRNAADVRVVPGTYGLDTIIVDSSKLKSVIESPDPFEAAAMVSVGRSFDIFDELPPRYQHIISDEKK